MARKTRSKEELNAALLNVAEKQSQEQQMAYEMPWYNTFMFKAAAAAGTALATLVTVVSCLSPKSHKYIPPTYLPGSGDMTVNPYHTSPGFVNPGPLWMGFDPDIGQDGFATALRAGEDGPDNMPHVKNLALVAVAVGVACAYHYYTDSNTTKPAGESSSADSHH